jgi:hypothetical protein
MNIKSNEAHELAAELARLRGTTITQAVTDALRSEVNRERGRSQRLGMARDLMRIGKRCAAHISGPLSSQDHATMLYDEQGLPR